jgi:succinate dehydrogenase/fumarate reductase flavoprotein subunit
MQVAKKAISMQWDREVDVLVFGAGMAGMASALVAKCEGLDVLVCEKSHLVGGTTATSGGATWVPGNSLSHQTSNPDSVESGRTYLDAEMGPDRSGLREAFLTTGAEAIDYFERNTDVKFKASDPYPDYHAEQPGGAAGGRALSPIPFDGRLLGLDFEKLRPPIPEFMVLGGMMVARNEIGYLIRPWRSFTAFKITVKRVLRYAIDRLKFQRGTHLVLGNALAGRLFYSCLRKDVEIALNTQLVELVTEGERVVGALVDNGGQSRAIRARRGVVLATGGCGANRKWRDELAGQPVPHTQVLDEATGDGLDAGISAGGVVEKAGIGSFWWFPSSRIEYPNGQTAMFPHLRDRPKPGLIAVNALGRRFVNEADSYHDFANAMFRSNEQAPSIPAWLVCDRAFLRNYGLGVIHPVWQRISYFEKIGYVTSAATLSALAQKICVDEKALVEEVHRHNQDAIAGIDTAFGKGSKAFNRHNGDKAHGGSNPCLKPIEHGPFFALRVYPAPLGVSAGLTTNDDCQVLNASGDPIEGLYACGNDMRSVLRGHYPGPGSTLGPAIVFAYRAAMHAAGSHSQLMNRNV